LPVRRVGNLEAMTTSPAPLAPSGPQESRPKQRPNPLVVAGIAFAVGRLLAKVIDWRSHAHPRR
jgi:hypothetical protein